MGPLQKAVLVNDGGRSQVTAEYANGDQLVKRETGDEAKPQKQWEEMRPKEGGDPMLGSKSWLCHLIVE